MLAPPTAPATPPNDSRALLDRQLAMLGQLAEAGLSIALAIERQATSADEAPPAEAGPAPDPCDLGLAYARVSRAVRLTIALQSKLVEDSQAFDRGAFQARHERRRTVERIVGRVIEAEHDGPDGDAYEAERLAGEASERLDCDDIYGDIAARPVSEIVADICRDLGLSPNWPRLAEEAWARAEIESGCAGAPLAALADRPARKLRPTVAGPRRPAPRTASP